MRMRKKKNLGPRLERCGELLISSPEQLRGNWRARLNPGCQLRVELGCGKGRFTAETALANPDVLFVAVERVADAMVIAMERVKSAELTNVLFVIGDAARLPELFAPGEVDLIYINFCDPWPSNRHARRRLTSEGFLRLYRAALADRGEIHFKTDNRDLFEFSLLQFGKAGFLTREVTRDLHRDGPAGVMTDYESKFVAAGLPICRCVAEMPCTDMNLEP